MTGFETCKHDCLRNVIIGPQEQVTFFFPDEPVDIGHVARGDGHTSQAACRVEGDVLSPAVVIDPFGGVDHDAAGEGAAIGELETFQVETGLVSAPTMSCDFKSAEGRTVAPWDIAEDGGLVGAAFPGAMHGVSGINHLSVDKGPDEQAGLPAGDAVVDEQAIVLVEPFPLGVFERLFRPEFQLVITGIARDSTGIEQAACRGGVHDGSQKEEPKSEYKKPFHRCQIASINASAMKR